MRAISAFWIHAFIVIFLASYGAEARTRAPKTENERSLLYWRYLCENQPQSETIKTENSSHYSIELTCSSQNWKVRAENDQVREVVEDAKK